MSQYPAIGAVLTLKQGDSGEVAYDDVELIKLYGTARLYAAKLEDGTVGVIAIHPNGGWWLVRDFEEPEEWDTDKWQVVDE
jgi:hypothetical protein